MMVGFESGDTVERGCGTAAPLHWSCNGYYGIGWIWISLSHSSSTHYRYFKQPALHLRGVEPARSPDLSPIENMWSMVAQRLIQITPQADTPNQLWQRVDAAWSAVLQEYIQSLFESIPRRVAAVISNNGGYSGY
ncbi:transposable element Tcb1 transposase [Trichonephila clavipes]|nr:transposable element Tcb1 transposase [Trichonephila clavipes]